MYLQVPFAPIVASGRRCAVQRFGTVNSMRLTSASRKSGTLSWGSVRLVQVGGLLF
jgi:hypothetical protein